MKKIFDNEGRTYALNENYQHATVTENPVLYKTIARNTGEGSARIVVASADWIGADPETLSATEWKKVNSDENFICYAKLPVGTV